MNLRNGKGQMVFKILLMLSAICQFALSQAEELSCRIDRVADSLGESRVDLVLGDRRVSILGWAHLSPYNKDKVENAKLLVLAVEAADHNDCNKARRRLTRLYLDQFSHFKASLNLTKRLKNVDQQINPDVIGVEYSPKNWRERIRTSHLENKMVRFIAEKCPSETKGLITNISNIFPGPEYKYFMSTRSDISVQPIEDEAVSSKLVPIIEEMNSLPDIEIDSLDARFVPLIRNALINIKTGKPIPESQIEKIAMVMGNQEEGEIVVKELKLLNQVIKLNGPRNEKMAEKILRGTGNYVVTIGDSHVDDLANRLLLGCKKTNQRDSQLVYHEGSAPSLAPLFRQTVVK